MSLRRWWAARCGLLVAAVSTALARSVAGWPAELSTVEPGGPEDFKLNAAFYLGATQCGILAIVGVAGLVLWLVLRHLRRTSAGPGPPP